MNYVLEYADKVLSGKIVACKRIKQVYKKIAEEIRNPEPDSKYYFDEEVGERPILFIEEFCKQSQGALGEAIVLDLWQKAAIQATFGFLYKSTGYRRYNELMLLCGRKNGKTTLLSGIALYMLIADYEGAAEIYSVATKKDQARKVLTEAVNMVKQSPELRAILKKRRNDLYFAATSSYFEALASDSNTLDGLNAHAVIIDELHAIRDRNLYDVTKQSTTARRQPLIVIITTAGTLRECIYDSTYKRATEVVDGIVKDEHTLYLLYECDYEDEWLKEECWIKANPGLGTIKSIDTLRQFVERAKTDEEFAPTVKCKDFNIKQTSAKSWLSYEKAVNPATYEMQDIYDTYAIGGCDLSATTDLTCATLLIRKRSDPIVYIAQMYFVPEKKVAELENKKGVESVPYRAWAERGLVTICKGNRVNFSQVTEWFVQMREEFKIDPQKVGYDRALAGYWVDEMEQNGFIMEPVAQGPFTWSQPMKEMGAALEAKTVNYNNNPVLLWNLTNTGVKSSGLNNIQPVKISEPLRIDGTVSMLNAWVVYVKDYDDFMYMVGE